MSFRCLSFLLITSAFAHSAVLRACADPDNLPFSNQQQQGFENKLAELLASNLGLKLEYAWWPERKSFVKHTLEKGRCDVLLGVPVDLASVETTRPYYRSSYVFVSRRDRNLQIEDLTDPRLATLKIGVQITGDGYSPPAIALARRGITQNFVSFPVFGSQNDDKGTPRIIDAVSTGEVDVAIVWGPLAGYFARLSQAPLDIVPVKPEVCMGLPLAYDISLGVRKGDHELCDRLNRALIAELTRIREIMNDYGVPEVH